MSTRHSRVRGAVAALLLLSSLLATTAEAASASVVYTYDELGRLTTALYDNGTCVVYSYDPSGNRTSQTNTSSSSSETPVWGVGAWGCFPWTAAQSSELVKPAGDGSLRSAAIPRADMLAIAGDERPNSQVGFNTQKGAQ